MKPHKLSSFAVETEKILEDGKVTGARLLICGEEYKAWLYDTYIFDAIEIAKNWRPNQRTYDRIVHLRYWLRENIQHGHGLEIEDLRSMRDVKNFIDRLIDREYEHAEDCDEIKEHDIKTNAAMFGRDRL